jgi:hypothetical protein
LLHGPIVWYVALDNLEPVDLNDRISAIRIVHCAGVKPAPDTVCDGAAYGVHSVGACKLSEKLKAPRCPNMASV